MVEICGHWVVNPLFSLQVHHDVEDLEPGCLEVGQHGLHMLQLVLHVLLALLASKLWRFLQSLLFFQLKLRRTENNGES